MAPGHAELRGLLAAHAVGALEEPERTVLDDHVTGCEACREELHLLQEAAASMLVPEGEAPSAAWTRIARALHDRAAQPDGPGRPAVAQQAETG